MPSPDSPPPARRDPWIWLLAGLAFVLQLWTLGRIDGYLLADSVEYMDRAQEVARGASLDPSTVRSFAFSALLVPLFWLVELVGAPNVWAVGLARLLVMAAGLATIAVVYRAGRRAFGVRAGVVAGFLIAVNPTFLQFGVEPLSENVATLGVALALAAVLRLDSSAGSDRKLAVRAGLWLGFALLMAFKTIPIAGVVLAGLFLIGRWKRRILWLAATGVYLGAALVQCLLDWIVYGRFGGSLGTYLIENVGGLLAGQLIKLHGLGVPYAYDLAVHIYENMSAAEQGSVTSNAGNINEVIRSSTSETWYLDTLTQDFLMLPLALALGFGLLVALKRRRALVWLLVAVAALNLALLSTKSAKSWRLVIPLLPAFALLAGLGVQTLFAELKRHVGVLGSAVATFLTFWLLWAGLAGGQAALARTNLTQYGAWWQATADLQALADAAESPWTFASAYHWAVRFRAQDGLELTKLPHHMDRWGELTSAEREATLAAVGELDAFLAHLQILTQDARIMDVVNARFQIQSVHFDPAAFEDLGPLYVLVRRDLELPHANRNTPRTFFDLHRDADPGAYQAALTNAHSVDFRRRQPDGSAWQMVLLGFDLETGLAKGQLAWLTLHWYVGNTGGRDFTIVSRVTDRDDRALTNNHEPAYGVWTTDKLEAGWILAESLPIVLPIDPNVFGGPDARGSTLATRFWLAIAEFAKDADGNKLNPPQTLSGLNPFRPSGTNPIGKPPAGAFGMTTDGYRWSSDGLFQVGGFWLPVPPALKLD